jgi:hypothetical protein
VVTTIMIANPLGRERMLVSREFRT